MPCGIQVPCTCRHNVNLKHTLHLQSPQMASLRYAAFSGLVFLRSASVRVCGGGCRAANTTSASELANHRLFSSHMQTGRNMNADPGAMWDPGSKCHAPAADISAMHLRPQSQSQKLLTSTVSAKSGIQVPCTCGHVVSRLHPQIYSHRASTLGLLPARVLWPCASQPMRLTSSAYSTAFARILQVEVQFMIRHEVCVGDVMMHSGTAGGGSSFTAGNRLPL